MAEKLLFVFPLLVAFMTTVADLFKNLVHIGHRADKWNPKMRHFVYGKSNGIYLLDLNKTLESLQKAQHFLQGLKAQNKKVLFVGTKPQSALEIHRQWKDHANLFYVDKKWTPGLLTNFTELRRRIDFYLTLKQQFESGEINKYTKKEVAKFKKELVKLEDSYGGVAQMRNLPDLVVVLDTKTEALAIDEAKVRGIPVMGIVDANADPSGVTYPIPGNDDSIRSIRFLLEKLLEPWQ